MNQTSKKGESSSSDETRLSQIIDRAEGDSTVESRRLRKINPLGMRVVVALQPESNRTNSGLYLPEGAKQMMSESVLAQVVEVASAVDDDNHQETNISGIPHGALVLIPQKSGIRVPWDDDLRIIETKEVLAIVDEIEMI